MLCFLASFIPCFKNLFFFSEKHRLFKEIYNNSTQKCGTEIKRCKLLDECSNLMITDCTTVKKRKLDFELRTLQLQYADSTTIMNEIALNQIINIGGSLSNVSLEMTKWKDSNFLKIVEVKLFDKTGVMKLIISNHIVNSIVENKGCSLTYPRTGKYDNKIYLKTSERTTYTANESLTEEEMKSDDATLHKMKFSIKDFFSRYDQNRFHSK